MIISRSKQHLSYSGSSFNRMRNRLHSRFRIISLAKADTLTCYINTIQVQSHYYYWQLKQY